MAVLRSLWVSVQGDPVFMRRVNGWLTIFWLLMIPVSIATHWIDSVVYVSALSLWALVSGHWSTWQAARVEVAQKEAERRHERVAQDVVEELVENTTIEPIRDPVSEPPRGGRPDHSRAGESQVRSDSDGSQVAPGRT